MEEKHIFSPTTINTARFGFSRNTWIEEPIESGPLTFGWFPDSPMGRIEMQGGIQNLGLWVNGQNVSNAFLYSDDLSMTRGRHDLKIGGSVNRYQVNDFTDGFKDGRYRFGGSVARYITGQPTSWDGKVPGAVSQRGIRQTVLSLYIQDDFKWRPNFTWNLGLRYEYARVPTEVNDRISNLDNPLTDDFDSIRHPANPIFENPSGVFAPRIGFAWDPFGDGKTSIRMGAGIFMETVLPYHFSQQIRRSPPDE